MAKCRVLRQPSPCTPACRGNGSKLTAAWLGLEVEQMEIPYPDLERSLRTAGPALLRLPDGSFAAILDNGNLLAPDLSVKRLKSGILSAQLGPRYRGAIDSGSGRISRSKPQCRRGGVPARARPSCASGCAMRVSVPSGVCACRRAQAPGQ